MPMGFIGRLLISALSLWVASRLVGGIRVNGLMTLLIAAFLLGLVNAIIKPILILLTLPITVVTLGLFLIVLNAAMLGLVAWMLPGFSIDGLVPAVKGWLIITLVSWIASHLI
jgi:putative membrane protein